jgi:hypothetical protein
VSAAELTATASRKNTRLERLDAATGIPPSPIPSAYMRSGPAAARAPRRGARPTGAKHAAGAAANTAARRVVVVCIGVELVRVSGADRGKTRTMGVRGFIHEAQGETKRERREGTGKSEVRIWGRARARCGGNSPFHVGCDGART